MRVVLVLTFALATVPAAFAQPTTNEIAACRSDAARLCKHALAGSPFTVGACLAANKAKLSSKCRAVVNAHGM